MGEVVQGLGEAARERIAALRADDTFFWIDASTAEAGRDELRDVLDVPEHALDRLLDFRAEVAPSKKLHTDGRHVAFPFTCYVGEAIEVHVVVTGDYILTLHEARISLPEQLEHEPPEGRSEQYFVYAVLEAMVGTAYDAVNAIELELEDIQFESAGMVTARVRIDQMRSLTSRLSAMRRRLGPQRGIFERVAEEIGHLYGLDSDEERYFERIGEQLNRIVAAIDAAGDAIAKLMDLRLNETTYVLTVVATVFLPLTFLTGFFGMNFGWMVRHVDSPLAFFVLGIGGCVAGVALTALFVRRRAAT